MDREDWMYLKAVAPGFGLMVLGAFVLWLMSRLLGGTELEAAVLHTWRWGPVAAMCWGALSMCWRSYRVHEALSGDGPLCPHCYGPLGSEVDGRYGPYRKCMNCRRNVALHKYQ